MLTSVLTSACQGKGLEQADLFHRALHVFHTGQDQNLEGEKVTQETRMLKWVRLKERPLNLVGYSRAKYSNVSFCKHSFFYYYFFK